MAAGAGAQRESARLDEVREIDVVDAPFARRLVLFGPLF